MNIRKRLTWILVAVGLSLVIQLTTSTAWAAEVVGGAVFLDNINQPIPGLMVYLAHPSRGPGSPAFTDARGRFLFSAPIDPDPYELMIFWGRELLYRRRVLVNGPGMQMVPIVLR